MIGKLILFDYQRREQISSLEALRKKNLERRPMALRAVRSVDPDFYLGKRAFDIPRKTEGKQEIIDELRRKEEELKK
ncbi:hypothetical protein [Salinicoccus sp. HZC-1]|uniref:hypothetical protein n=1 Tax=Salinicoccus sp. HZC-1 TaxID=3385497 RepID=UPI00398AB1FF